MSSSMIIRTFAARAKLRARSRAKAASKLKIAPFTNLIVVETVNSVFPGALKNADLLTKVTKALSSHGYGRTTLLATSFCCDEVSRQLEQDFSDVYGNHFTMGGLAGFPFGGETAFAAMADHIPQGGSCLVVYGPHVGIDADGVVGKVNRRGQLGSSGACCGSAAEAAAYVEKVLATGAPRAAPNLPSDIEQSFVRSALLPHGERLANAKDPAVELPHALFDIEDGLMKEIVCSSGGHVHDGEIALLGGIQINTPPGTSDYFLPKVFEVKNRDGETTKSLASSLS